VAGGSTGNVGDRFVVRWIRRSYLLARVLYLTLLVWVVLRAVLTVRFHDPAVTAAQLAGVFLAGTLIDIGVATACLVPSALLLALLRLRWLRRAWLQHGIVALAGSALTFDAFVQYFFFDEYDARYNHLALDYLVYPREVLGNIFASYDVPLFVALAAAAGLALAAATARWPAAEFTSWSVRDRLRATACTCVVAGCLWLASRALPAPLLPSRTTNELALNGWAELVRAYMTADLDYEAYYATVPAAEAARRVARLTGADARRPDLQRHFTPRANPPGGPLDIVIILEESLGSAFSARFGSASGAEEAVTPELDRWSREGLALTNVVANGNRTVRGLEGVLCSFLPLPGDAIVKRDRSEDVACIARVLAAQGYQTTFVYGGYGLFDNVKSFMLANGYQSFVEQPDYPADAFRTIWGVADEFVLDELIARQKAANGAGRRWFGTALTVSNHKPYAIPAGRVSWPSGASGRHKAVLYADWALGRYLARARDDHLLDHTVVLIVGDHGARVYGAEEIPVSSYRVPAVLLTPEPSDRGRVIDRLASQIDLAPTALSLAGVAYDAPFFGRDLLGLPPDGGRAFVNHNRSIGMLTDTAMVVLGLHQDITFYGRANRQDESLARVGASPALGDIARDAEAMFQTAYHRYRDRAYRLPPKDTSR